MNNYSSDPIQPGVSAPYGNQKSGGSSAKLVVIILLLFFFVLPLAIIICFLIFASSVVKTVVNNGIVVNGSDIVATDVVAMQSLEAFQLSARYPRYRDAGLVTHEDCTAISNAIMRLDDDAITGPARWFGNGFCENDEIEVYSESYYYEESDLYGRMPDGGASIEMEGININFDSVLASVLSFSDGTRCASFTLGSEGILDYQIEDIEDSKFCKTGGAKIKLGDNKDYEAPKESTFGEGSRFESKSSSVPQTSI